MKGKGRKKSAVSNNDIESALVKKALGYDATETVEEYSETSDGEVKLTKKKVTVKNVPPDMSALKYLLEERQKQVGDMTDEQLKEEKIRLLNLLKSLNGE